MGEDTLSMGEALSSIPQHKYTNSGIYQAVVPLATVHELKKIPSPEPDTVAHVCNPSYSGGRDQED
jgi:hypothetical protein